MTVVVDASAVVAALVDGGPAGTWAQRVLVHEHLAAPHLMLVEAASILRRAVLAGDLTADVATLAHGDLVELPVDLFPYEPHAARVWELRGAVTPYDAWYVALAEALDVPVVTLDAGLARAPGPTCAFRVAPRTDGGAPPPTGARS
ncbi:MAG: type II toxin-antitoxin system VapC family toxin [Actinomycetota bacterium]|nr:type II toxin-antitoxin system VapC family toxin [Actinomycetota bacterium]